MDRPLGLYVHFPFCARKCAYCDFPSYAGKLSLRAPYTQALCREIAERANSLPPLAADTVFLGGGTPSLMQPQQMARILECLREHFTILPDAEITCEANPGSLSADFLSTLRELGVNRLSFGAQSAQETELKLLGRTHTWAQVEKSFGMARAAGFQNISLDLLTGLPGQDWETLRDTLEDALRLSPCHISCYSLIIEEGTPFYSQVQNGTLSLPDETAERAMYWNVVEYLQAEGFFQYEISNFAKPGMACRHNLNCWKREEYLGFGAAAAGFYRGERRRNPTDPEGYLAGDPPEIQTVTPGDARFESVMLGLRMTAGLDASAFYAAHAIRLMDAYPEAITRNTQNGLLQWAGEYLRLSRAGMDLMDRVLLDFLP